jgi:hypothetical protein
METFYVTKVSNVYFMPKLYEPVKSCTEWYKISNEM